MKFLLFISLLIALSACSDLKKGGQLDRLTDLENRLEKGSENLVENRLEDQDELKQAKELVYGQISSMEDDTISLDQALMYDELKLIFTMLDPALTQYDELIVLIEEEKAVLKKLKSDIDAANGKRHKYGEYINHEEKKVTELEKAITNYIESKTQISTTFDKLYNEIANLTVEPIGPDGVQ